MDHRLADAVGPDELDIVLTIVDDFPIKIQVHAFVVECVDVARAHRTVEIAFGRALKRDFDWTAVERGFVAKITECNVPTVSQLLVHSFQPSAMKPNVYARS